MSGNLLKNQSFEANSFVHLLESLTKIPRAIKLAIFYILSLTSYLRIDIVLTLNNYRLLIGLSCVFQEKNVFAQDYVIIVFKYINI